MVHVEPFGHHQFGHQVTEAGAGRAGDRGLRRSEPGDLGLRPAVAGMLQPSASSAMTDSIERSGGTSRVLPHDEKSRLDHRHCEVLQR